MFSFFRKSQDSKKVAVPEREADGFVIVGVFSIFHDRALLTKRNFRTLDIVYDGTTATKSSVNALEHERKFAFCKPVGVSPDKWQPHVPCANTADVAAHKLDQRTDQLIRYFTKYCIVLGDLTGQSLGADDSIEQACMDLGVMGFHANWAWAKADCCSRQLLPGDTIDDQSRESKDKTSFPETRPMYNPPPQINTGHRSQLTVSSAEVGNERSQNLESSPFMSDLLSDVPFALAPHVLAVQGTHNDVPDRLLTYDINDNLSRFWYDFTLENSVLCDP
nr:PREDICTED: uncharacterized protein LOC104330904 [Opisthocomus hoazin]